ncbi:MAG: molybdenum cofactor guanylyltransferase MobA [Rhodospirillales bacterium]
MPPERATPPVGVILAGGRATRMGGGDKCLRRIGGRTLLEHVIERARPQVSRLIVSANGDPGRFAPFGLPVVADGVGGVGGFAGPLAGVLSGLAWARVHATDCLWVASFAADTPFFPDDLVTRMRAAVADADADLACAASGGRTHPVFGLWPVRLADALRHALDVEAMRRIDRWTARYRLATAEYPASPRDPFFNVNGPDDLAAAERMLD